MRFEERPDEQRFEAAYRALGELRIALRAIAYRQPNASAQATLERVTESHLGAVEQLVKSDHMAYLRKAPPPRLLVTDEDKRRDPKPSEALARCRKRRRSRPGRPGCERRPRTPTSSRGA